MTLSAAQTFVRRLRIGSILALAAMFMQTPALHSLPEHVTLDDGRVNEFSVDLSNRWPRCSVSERTTKELAPQGLKDGQQLI